MLEQLHVEALRRPHLRQVLLAELPEDRRLAGVVEAEHEDFAVVVVLLQLLQHLHEARHGRGCARARTMTAAVTVVV